MKIETLIEAIERVCEVAMANGVKDPELRSAIVDLLLLKTTQYPTINVYVDGVKQAAKEVIDAQTRPATLAEADAQFESSPSFLKAKIGNLEHKVKAYGERIDHEQIQIAELEQRLADMKEDRDQLHNRLTKAVRDNDADDAELGRMVRNMPVMGELKNRGELGWTFASGNTIFAGSAIGGYKKPEETLKAGGVKP